MVGTSATRRPSRFHWAILAQRAELVEGLDHWA
jgi:hypothetical protein